MPAPAARGSAIRAAIVLVPLLNFLGGASAKVSGQTGDSTWFKSLVLPAVQPPGIVFPIAWTILYTLLAIAAALVWGTRVRGRWVALGLFVAQLALNLAWAPLFFRDHQIFYSLVLLGVIWLAAVITTFAFARVNRVAAWLLVPYLVWLSFAASLNYDIWRFNPQVPAAAAQEQ